MGAKGEVDVGSEIEGEVGDEIEGEVGSEIEGEVGSEIERLIVGAVAGAAGARREVLERALLQRGAELDPLLDALAVHAAAGEDVALELLLEVVHRLGLARPAIARLLPDPSTVDDVAQATLITVERRISSFEGRSKFRTWLFTVARNETLMMLRRRRPTPSDPTDPAGAIGLAAETGGGRFSSVIVSRQTIQQLIEALPEPYRETLKLQVYTTLDYEQIGVRLGVPVGTVRSRLAKARELLRPQIER